MSARDMPHTRFMRFTLIEGLVVCGAILAAVIVGVIAAL